LLPILPPCTIGLEACSGAHQLARERAQLGHTVRIIAAKFVAPYRAREVIAELLAHLRVLDERIPTGRRAKDRSAPGSRAKTVAPPRTSNPPLKEKAAEAALSRLYFRAAQNFQITATLITSTSLSAVTLKNSPPTS